jgi:hypothetical protein
MVVVFTFVFLVYLTIVNSSYNLIAEVTAFDQHLGLYFPGEIVSEHEIYSYILPEHFLQVVEPNSFGLEAIHFDTSLLIRSSNLQYRVLLQFRAAPAEETETTGNLYHLTFHNLAWGDRNGDSPLELQYSETENVWIEGNFFFQMSFCNLVLFF